MEIAPRQLLRSSIEKRQFSPTYIEDFLCSRRGYLSRTRGLKPKTASIHLVAGSAIHLAVGTFYAMRESDGFATASKAGLDALVTHWESANVKTLDDYKNLPNLIRVFEGYCKRYQHDTVTFNPENIEISVSMPMPNDTTMVLVLDRWSNVDGYISLVDTKTQKSKPTEYSFRRYENDFQTSSYYYAIEQHLGHCDSIQIDAIGIPKSTHSLTPSHFIRKPFLRSPIQMADWMNTWIKRTDYILAGMALDEDERMKYFHTDPSRCGDYGGCPYLPICQNGTDAPELQYMFDGG